VFSTLSVCKYGETVYHFLTLFLLLMMKFRILKVFVHSFTIESRTPQVENHFNLSVLIVKLLCHLNDNFCLLSSFEMWIFCWCVLQNCEQHKIHMFLIVEVWNCCGKQKIAFSGI
jgi:hypothetical protein